MSRDRVEAQCDSRGAVCIENVNGNPEMYAKSRVIIYDNH